MSVQSGDKDEREHLSLSLPEYLKWLAKFVEASDRSDAEFSEIVGRAPAYHVTFANISQSFGYDIEDVKDWAAGVMLPHTVLQTHIARFIASHLVRTHRRRRTAPATR